jgi:hypothetical protein
MKQTAGDLILINSGAVHGFFDQSEGISCRGFQVGITFFGEDFIELRGHIFDNSILAGKAKRGLLIPAQETA